MRKYVIVLALLLALPAVAQQQRPSPDEAAFAALPADLQAMLAHLPPHEALQKVQFARQNLIAVGLPNPSPEQLRATVARVLQPEYRPLEGSVESASAGASSFPPLSPLVSPYTPQR